MYVVISGEKTFTLLPPSDAAFLPILSVPTIHHTIIDGSATGTGTATPTTSHHRVKANELGMSSRDPDERISWIAVDVDAPGVEEEYKDLFARVRPIRCTVKAGETLYIPSLWYHQVSQTKLTISVNFWYEMKFDFRCVWFRGDACSCH